MRERSQLSPDPARCRQRARTAWRAGEHGVRPAQGIAPEAGGLSC